MNGWNFDLRTLDWQTSQKWIWILFFLQFLFYPESFLGRKKWSQKHPKTRQKPLHKQRAVSELSEMIGHKKKKCAAPLFKNWKFRKGKIKEIHQGLYPPCVHKFFLALVKKNLLQVSSRKWSQCWASAIRRSKPHNLFGPPTSPVFPSGTFSVPASLLLSQRSKKQYLLRLCAFTPNKSLFQMSVLPHSALPFCRWLERIKRFWWSCKWPSSCSVDAASYLEIPVFGAYSTERAHLVAV